MQVNATVASPLTDELQVLSVHGATVVFMQPDARESVPDDPYVALQRVYQKLSQLPQKYHDKAGDLVIVAPESTFPYALSDYPDALSLWQMALPLQASFVIGSQRVAGEGEQKKWYQTVFWLHEGRIKNYYDKRHRVIFTEDVPQIFRNAQWAKGLFLQGKHAIRCGMQTEQPVVFTLAEKRRFIPRLCSELFMPDQLQEFVAQLARQEVRSTDVVLWLVNDSWFPPYFRRIMERLARLRAFAIGLPVLYVTHGRAVFFLPQ